MPLFLFVRTKSKTEVTTLKQVIKHSEPVWHQILNCCRRRKPDWSGFREVVSIEPYSCFLLRKRSATECPAWRSGPGRFFRFSENKIIHFFQEIVAHKCLNYYHFKSDCSKSDSSKNDGSKNDCFKNDCLKTACSKMTLQ